MALTEKEILANLGPLGALAGQWEGDEGVDESPAADRGPMTTRYRERAVFEVLGLVENHEQVLYGLRYSTTAWRLGEENPFHEELGYWLWDPAAGQVMRGFLVPRGVTVLAGGRAAAADRKLRMEATVGSATWGISSNPFLDVHFRTVRYELDVDLSVPDRFRYAEDTQLLMKGRSEVFHHRDSNTLKRVR